MLVQKSNHDSINECQEMMQLMPAYSKKREVGVHECVAHAYGINTKKCSCSVIFVPTDDDALKMSRPLSYLESTTPDSEDIRMTGFTKPNLKHQFQEMCLADFASSCRLVYGK